MVNHFIGNFFPHLSPIRQGLPCSGSAARGSPPGRIICHGCKSRFTSYQQLANHKRKQGGCTPGTASAQARTRSASLPSSPLRQFNAFASNNNSLSHSPADPSSPLQQAPEVDATSAAGTGDFEEGDQSYHHLISPEPRTSAVGQQVGARFEQVRNQSPSSGPSTPEDPEEATRHEYVAFIKNCNGGRGLSRQDQNWLLSFAAVPGLRNAKDVQHHIEMLPQPVSSFVHALRLVKSHWHYQRQLCKNSG